MVVRELITKLGFQTDTSGINQADSSMSSFLSKIPIKGAVAAAAIAVIAKQVIDIGKAALFAAADMEMLTTQFEVMLGDAGAADKMMDQLNQFAASTPFAMDTLAKGSQQLLSFGVEADNVIETMRMLGDTAGGNAEKLNGLVLAYGKVQVKGKASMEEINMIAERGLPIYDVLAKQLNTTKEGLFGMISAGQVSAEAVKTSFKTMTSEGGMFFKGMEKQSLTFHGLVSSMYDNFSLTLAAAGKVILPLAKDVVSFISDMATALKPVLESVFLVIGIILKPLITLLKAVLSPLLTILSTVFTIISAVLKVIFKVVTLIWDLFTKYFYAPVAFLMGKLKEFSAWIESGVGPVLAWLTEQFAKLEEIINTYVVPILNTVFVVLEIVFEILGGLIRLIWDYFISALKAIWDFFSWIGGIIWDFLYPAFKVLGEFFGWLGNLIMTYIFPAFKSVGDIFDWIGQKISEFIDWVISLVNKLPGVNISRDEIKKKVSVKTPSASQQMMKGTSPKTTNVSMKNNITMKGTGNTKEDVTRIAESIFTIQLKQVLTDAGI